MLELDPQCLAQALSFLEVPKGQIGRCVHDVYAAIEPSMSAGYSQAACCLSLAGVIADEDAGRPREAGPKSEDKVLDLCGLRDLHGAEDIGLVRGEVACEVDILQACRRVCELDP